MIGTQTIGTRIIPQIYALYCIFGSEVFLGFVHLVPNSCFPKKYRLSEFFTNKTLNSFSVRCWFVTYSVIFHLMKSLILVCLKWSKKLNYRASAWLLMLRSCRRQICPLQTSKCKITLIVQLFTPRRPNLVPELERIQNWILKDYSRLGSDKPRKFPNPTDPLHCWVLLPCQGSGLDPELFGSVSRPFTIRKGGMNTEEIR